MESSYNIYHLLMTNVHLLIKTFNYLSLGSCDTLNQSDTWEHTRFRYFFYHTVHKSIVLLYLIAEL